jgi:hypothetical protein
MQSGPVPAAAKRLAAGVRRLTEVLGDRERQRSALARAPILPRRQAGGPLERTRECGF